MQTKKERLQLTWVCIFWSSLLYVIHTYTMNEKGLFRQNQKKTKWTLQPFLAKKSASWLLATKWTIVGTLFMLDIIVIWRVPILIYKRLTLITSSLHLTLDFLKAFLPPPNRWGFVILSHCSSFSCSAFLGPE